MPAQSIVVPSFIQGVSRQAQTQRLDGSAEEIINGYPDLSSGLTKRNGLKYQHTLSTNNPDDDYSVHWLLTGGNHFVMLLSDDATEPIQVYSLDDGRKITVAYTGTSKAYVASGSTADRWKVLSVFDSTLIANSDVVTALKGSASTYSVTSVHTDLNDAPDPSASVEGNIYKTLNSSVGRPAGYYQVNNPYSVNEVDNWTRLKSPSANSEPDEETLPVQMLYDATANSGDGQFNVQQPDWTDRLSGDEITNPGPSFIGRSIDDMVFHKDRLWIFADEAACASRTRFYFTFWKDDVYNLTNQDTIDEFISDEGLNKIRYAIPFNKALNIFTEGNRQFEIRSDGPMAPDSINIIPTTNYGVSDKARPVKLGSQLYFFTPHTDSSQLFEYYYLDNAANNIAEDVSEHVTGYIQDEITNITGEVNNGLILSHTTDTTRCYPYKMLWSSSNKLQSAWSTWDIADCDYLIQSSKVFDDDIWFLLKVEGSSTTRFALATISVSETETDTDVPYSMHLDFYSKYESGTYDSGTNTTYWDLPLNVLDNDVVVIRTEGEKAGLGLPATVTEQSEHVSRVTVTGDFSTTDVTIGVPFLFSVTLNKPYVRDNQRNPVTGSLALKKLILYIRDAIQFDLIQTVPGIEQPYTAKYSSVKFGGTNVVYNSIPIVEFDDPSFILLGKADGMQITISDTSQFPLKLVSAEYRGFFNPRRPVK